MDVFTSPEFLSFRREMRESLKAMVDPSDAAVSTVLPGVNERLDRIGHSLEHQSSMITGCARQCHDLGGHVHGLRQIVQQMCGGIESVDNKVSTLTTKTTKMHHAALAFAVAGQENHVNVCGSPSKKHVECTAGTNGLVPLAPRANDVCPDESCSPPTSEEQDDFRIPEKWKSMQELLDFWKGVEMIESNQKSRWRRNFTDAKRKLFSRMKIVCTTLSDPTAFNGTSMEEIDRLLTVDCRGSLCSFEKLLKKKGWYKPTTRKKKSVTNTTTAVAARQVQQV
jgi:hypothetical protein